MIFFQHVNRSLLLSECKNYRIVIIKAGSTKLYSCFRLKNIDPELWEPINENLAYNSFHQAQARTYQVHRSEPEKAIHPHPNIINKANSKTRDTVLFKIKKYLS